MTSTTQVRFPTYPVSWNEVTHPSGESRLGKVGSATAATLTNLPRLGYNALVWPWNKVLVPLKKEGEQASSEQTHPVKAAEANPQGDTTPEVLATTPLPEPKVLVPALLELPEVKVVATSKNSWTSVAKKVALTTAAIGGAAALMIVFNRYFPSHSPKVFNWVDQAAQVTKAQATRAATQVIALVSRKPAAPSEGQAAKATEVKG